MRSICAALATMIMEFFFHETATAYDEDIDLGLYADLHTILTCSYRLAWGLLVAIYTLLLTILSTIETILSIIETILSTILTILSTIEGTDASTISKRERKAEEARRRD